MTARRDLVLLASLLTIGAAAPATAATWQRLDNSATPFSKLSPAVTSWVFANGVEFADVYGVTNTGSVAVTQLYVNNGGDPFPLGTLDLGGKTAYAPAALRLANTDNTPHQELFAIGTDNGLYHKWTNSGSPWTNWVSLGKPAAGLCSAPSAVSWSHTTSRIDVFAVGCDGNLWQIWSDGAWHSWVLIAHNVLFGGGKPVTAVARGCIGCLDVFALSSSPTGTTLDLLDFWFNGSWHTSGTNVGATGTEFPTSAGVINNYPTAFVLYRKESGSSFARAENKNGLPGQFWGGSFLGIADAFGEAGGAPPVAVSARTLIEYYYFDTSFRVRRIGYQPGTVTKGDWVDTSINLTGASFAGGLGGYAPVTIDGIVVVAVKPDGTMWFAVDTDR